MDYVTYIRNMVGHSKIFLVAAGMIVHNERGEILLQQRRDCGLWGLSGGICELEESVEETAHRELMEETGLTAEIEYLLGVYSKGSTKLRNGDEIQCVTVIFVSHITGGAETKGNEETISLGWFSKDELPEIFSQKHKRMIEDYFEGGRGVWR